MNTLVPPLKYPERDPRFAELDRLIALEKAKGRPDTGRKRGHYHGRSAAERLDAAAAEMRQRNTLAIRRRETALAAWRRRKETKRVDEALPLFRESRP